jgi:hypothetical protein
MRPAEQGQEESKHRDLVSFRDIPVLGCAFVPAHAARRGVEALRAVTLSYPEAGQRAPARAGRAGKCVCGLALTLSVTAPRLARAT